MCAKMCAAHRRAGLASRPMKTSDSAGPDRPGPAGPPVRPPAAAAVTLPDLIEARAAADPDRVALCVVDGEALTSGDWLARARPVAGALARRGVGPGDRVGLLFAADAWIDYAVAALGVYLAGGAVVGLSAPLGPREAGRRLAAVDAVGLLHGSGVAVPAGPRWAEPLPRLAAESGPASGLRSPAPSDLVEILHTSGTTGPAKPVAVTHANLTHGRDTAMDRVAGPAGGVLTPVPLGTNAGHSAILAALT